MKKALLIVTVLLVFALSNLDAQEFYPVSSGELLFQFGNVELANSNVTSEPMRFTFFLHLGQYWHLDIGNYVGFADKVDYYSHSVDNQSCKLINS